MQSQPHPERVNLIFNERIVETPVSEVEKPTEIYKNYIIKQNNNLWTENKKLTEEKFNLDKKYEELEEESDTAEKRLRNTKNFLKNFRFINDALEIAVNKYEKFNKDLHINVLINYFRLILGLFGIFVVLFIFFGFNKWFFIPLQVGFVTGFHEFFIPLLKNIEKKQLELIKLKKEKDTEIKEMTKTMDIISEFIDNAL